MAKCKFYNLCNQFKKPNCKNCTIPIIKDKLNRKGVRINV
jgi:hypothetical protein